MSNTCQKCNRKGWYSYDENHGKPCEECCAHSGGWWELPEGYTNAGRLCCKDGCGTTKAKEKKIK